MQKILFIQLAVLIYISTLSCSTSLYLNNSNLDCQKLENAKIFVEKFAKHKLKSKYKNYELVKVVEDSSNFEFKYQIINTTLINKIKGGGIVIILSKSNCQIIKYYLLK